MSNYVYGYHDSYRDYLQADSLKNDVTDQIDASTRALIASDEQLIASLVQDVSQGFEAVSDALGDVSRSLSDLGSTFEWGFSEVLMSLGQVNASLSDLLKVAKTPAQTWAYEQFEIARDAFRQGLYDDALHYVEHAINGFGDQTGYRLEYRFHYLRGTIQLGSFKNVSKTIIDLPSAEDAFRDSAKYALMDAPLEAARAFLAAGWAAYCQGKMLEAEEFTLQATSLDPSVAEHYFQLAKVRMHLDRPQDAISPLRTAIGLERDYAVKAASDADCASHGDQLTALLTDLRDEAKQGAVSGLGDAENHLQAVSSRTFGTVPLSRYASARFGSSRSALDRGTEAAAKGTYFDYLDANQLAKESLHYSRMGAAEAAQAAATKARGELERFEQASARASASLLEWRPMVITCCFLVSLVVAVGQCSYSYTRYNKANYAAVVEMTREGRIATFRYTPGLLGPTNFVPRNESDRPYAADYVRSLRIEHDVPRPTAGTETIEWLAISIGGGLGLVLAALLLHNGWRRRSLEQLRAERGRIQGLLTSIDDLIAN